jgi:hypothetical protein
MPRLIGKIYATNRASGKVNSCQKLEAGSRDEVSSKLLHAANRPAGSPRLLAQGSRTLGIA